MPTTIRDEWIGSELRGTDIRQGPREPLNTVPPEYKGWFPYDRPTLARAAIATVCSAALRTYVITDRAAILDYSNALLFPLLLNLEPLNFTLWQFAGIDLTKMGGEFTTSALIGTALAAISMRDVLYSAKDVVIYGLAVGAFSVVGREVAERLMLHDNRYTAKL